VRVDVATAAAVQAIAAVVSLGLTGALVAITAYYAKQTRRTVEEMERGRSVTERTIDEMRKGREATDRTVAEMVAARELALMPTLTCRLDVDHERAARASNYMGAGTLDVAADYTALVLANAGNAPALDVALHIDGEPRDRGRLRAYRADGERVGIIGVGADWRRPLQFGKDYYLDPILSVDPHAPLDQAVVVRATYANAYGRRFLTCATFDLGGDARGIAWVQRDSSVELLGSADLSAEDNP